MADATLRVETAGPPATAPATAVPRTIVPLAGIPIVAVVLGALVAAIASNKLWALDFFHVAGGALWTSVDLFVGFDALDQRRPVRRLRHRPDPAPHVGTGACGVLQPVHAEDGAAHADARDRDAC